MCHHIENIVPKYNRLWVFNDHESRFISAKETCIFISCLRALLSIHHGVRHHDLVCMTLFLFIVVFIIMILSSWLLFFLTIVLWIHILSFALVLNYVLFTNGIHHHLLPIIFKPFPLPIPFQGHAFHLVFHFLLIVVPCVSKVMPRLTLWYHNGQGLISI